MELFVEPHKIALLKKLVLEKDSLEKNKYAALSLFAHYFGSFAYQDSFLAFILESQEKDFFKVPRYWFNPVYFQLRSGISNAWLSSNIPPGKVSKTYFKKLWRNIINKIEKDGILTIDEVLTIRDKFLAKDQQGVFYTFLSLGFAFPEGTKKISAYLKKYIASFMSGELVGSGTVRYYNYGLQRQGFEKIIGDNAQIYGPTNLAISLNEMWTNMQIINPNDQQARISQTRFWETLLAMEIEGLIKVVQVISPESARVTILSAKDVPTTNDWNSNFYSISSNLSFFNFIKKKKENRQTKAGGEPVSIVWESLSLNVKSGLSEYNGKQHHFMVGKPHFKVLKRLIEGAGKAVTYDGFFKVLGGDIEQSPKEGKEFVRQKVRDIRKYFGINRDINRELDVFAETGNGFKLMKITVGTEEIPQESQTTS